MGSRSLKQHFELFSLAESVLRIPGVTAQVKPEEDSTLLECLAETKASYYMTCLVSRRCSIHVTLMHGFEGQQNALQELIFKGEGLTC